MKRVDEGLNEGEALFTLPQLNLLLLMKQSGICIRLGGKHK